MNKPKPSTPAVDTAAPADAQKPKHIKPAVDPTNPDSFKNAALQPAGHGAVTQDF